MVTATGERNSGYRLSDEVVAREVGGETILLNLGTGTYFGLNEVGGKVWQLLDAGKQSADAICDSIEREFDAPRAVIEQDVQALLEDLIARGLVVRGQP